MDAEARFRALFVQAYPLLRRYASHRGMSPQDADDLVAATLEVAWRRLDDVPADDPMPWLYAVARNHRRNLRRAAVRRSSLLGRLTGTIGAGSASGGQPAPEDAVTADESPIREALARLPEGDAELLRLVAWDGLSPSQVSIVIGCSPGTARVRLHRARRRLAGELERSSPLQRRGESGQIGDANAPILSMEAPNG